MDVYYYTTDMAKDHMVSPAKRVHFEPRPHHLTYQPWARPSAIKVAIVTEKQGKLVRRSVSPKTTSQSIMKTTSRTSVLSNAVAERDASNKNKSTSTSSRSPDLPIQMNEKPKTSSGRNNKIDVERMELDRQQEEILKKVAAFKPLINSASANVELSNESSKRVEKNEAYRESEKKKNGSAKESKDRDRVREDKTDKKKAKPIVLDGSDTEISPTDKVLANKSTAPSKNALNFNVLQQQQQQASNSKSSSSKSPTRKLP